MGGTEATHREGAPGPDDPVSAESRHWRELAHRRESALRDLTRRPLVRAALALERRVSAPLGRLGHGRRRVRTRIDGLAVAAAGLGARRSLGRRRAALAQAVASLGPVPEGPTVTVIALGTEPDAVVQAIADATGDALCFVPDPVGVVDPGWVARLASRLGDGVVAASPTLVHPARPGWQATEHDLQVRSEGFRIELDASGTPIVWARGAGDGPTVGRAPVEVAAAPLDHLVVDRRAFLSAGGLSAATDDVAAIDLCVRLRARGGRVEHVADALVLDARPVPSRASLRRPVDTAGLAWRRVVEEHGAALASMVGAPGRRSRPARWVITTAVPSARLAPRWGDWHLAEGLARALRALGQDVDVQTHDRADSLSARAHDIHLVLHGLAAVRPTPGQRHVIWVISHPESVDPDECEAADLVVVASARFADDLRQRTSTPVAVLLQATDPDRFHPVPPVPEHQHPVTVVAKTRDAPRGIVADALGAGLRPAVYGSGWGALIDPALVVADHVDNERLPTVYSSAGVVLNDHWDTMKAWGFVSNRIFDVLACATPVISDDVPEILDLFGDTVPTYRTPDELGELVSAVLDDPAAARERAERGRALVLEHHTFAHRAQTLVDLIAEHAPPDPPATLRGPGVR